MVDDQDCGGREQLTIVFCEPIKGCCELGFVLVKSCTARATNQGINDDKLWLILFHQLDELGVTTKLPVTSDVSVTGDWEISFDQLFFQLRQTVVAL